MYHRLSKNADGLVASAEASVTIVKVKLQLTPSRGHDVIVLITGHVCGQKRTCLVRAGTYRRRNLPRLR